MFTTIQKWGNSLGVRIPGVIAKSLNISNGTQLEITERDGKITLTPVHNRYTLEELVSNITQDNRHEESDGGYPVGKEIW
ncbi:AbrB/MazE/SpoVT family DNA-binding domain-containing protein [Candidatus Magnetobacterium casense]|uniref:AbrB/MazE/SpoVT family DNA-binding domain-containing protein n=1 Tax=Candidatus Magnetobacterium casense TaxID=1455061 RepID=UPI00058EEE8A|nr:AbrB/MazE/SpoVT family DNA-binding domain-containing protein [Candidatus Magnetobacterium casensis]